MKQHALRMPDDVFANVEKRRMKVGLSRNEWIVRAMQWALEQPLTKRAVEKEI